MRVSGVCSIQVRLNSPTDSVNTISVPVTMAGSAAGTKTPKKRCQKLAPTTLACGAMVFATAMGAFGTAFTLASKFQVLPITIYNEFTNYANFALAASLSITLGLITWLALFATRQFARQTSGAATAGV